MIKKVLVVGANFVNKGAQSMLFTVTNEIKKRYSDCDVYFACNGEKYSENNYVFKRLLYTKLSQDLALGKHVNYINFSKIFIKNFAKFILGRSKDLFQIYDAKKIIPEINLIIDVSGYALADICNPSEHEYYLDNIRIAKKYDIPIILMPQSFGPFNYSEENSYIIDGIRELLPYCRAIYARENEGYEYLQKFNLNNLRYSTDLVLQNISIDKKNVCKTTYKAIVPKIEEHSIAVIPNYHCFASGLEEHSYSLYYKIIKTLLDYKKNVYIFRHASFDLEICRKIKSMFKNEERVHLIEREFDCIEYDEFIKKFEFIICSRYHGCVHAFKNYVPNII